MFSTNREKKEKLHVTHFINSRRSTVVFALKKKEINLIRPEDACSSSNSHLPRVVVIVCLYRRPLTSVPLMKPSKCARGSLL